MNLEEMKIVKTTALVGEIQDLTARCALVWSEDSVGRYSCESSIYGFYLTKTQTGEAVLDVSKSGSHFRSYRSSDVTELYDEVDESFHESGEPAKVRSVEAFLSQISGCS